MEFRNGTNELQGRMRKEIVIYMISDFTARLIRIENPNGCICTMLFFIVFRFASGIYLSPNCFCKVY